MEKNEKKKLTKWQIAIMVLGICFVIIGFVVMLLNVLDIVPALGWAGRFCLGFAWLCIGILNWKRTRWISIVDYVLAAVYIALGVIELIQQYF